MDELQEQISSEHFTELLAFCNRNTLAPDQWWSAAGAASLVFSGLTGQWIDPSFLVPGQVDVDELNERRQEAAEKALDRKASNGGDR
ncbi:hypothetical protein [Rhodopirellula bahusiensis]|uniref:hypothetical protein n=1 Tax=Rhodopirellula bahusiensis TaxID=2014065 RepID=UPI003263B631